jgi:hypothetical protein
MSDFGQPRRLVSTPWKIWSASGRQLRRRRMNVFVTLALSDLHKDLAARYSEVGRPLLILNS